MIRTERIPWRLYRRNAAITAAAAGVLLSCSDSMSPDKSGTFFGPLTTVANGTARSFAILDAAGLPTDVGVVLSEAALTGLPAASTEFLIELPREASATAYEHATLNWQPMGHGPPGTVYTAPHFDLHVYMVTQSERAAMVTGTVDLSAKMVRPPAAEFIPAGFVAGMVVPQMGMHWTDPAAPERNGQPFVHAFYYGSYDGVFMLHEPMVTKAFLETKPVGVVTPIKLAAQYASDGYQATSYTIGYDAGAKEYRIALSGLVNR
jgi:hypothetical protein